MLSLILGVLLWFAAHLFKRLAPGPRAAMGDAGKGIVAALLAAAIVLMVMGYRSVPNLPNVVTIPGNGHINNLLMLIALVVFGAGMAKGVLWAKIRHPMLLGTVIWSIAHLLVRNDLPSVVLFGGMGLWAILSMALINRTGPWVRPAPGRATRDIVLVLIAAVMYAVLIGIHMAFGYPTFLGTYS